MEPAALVEASERLYRSLFSAATALMLATSVWGMVIVPFNSFNAHPGRSLGIGTVLVGAGLFALLARHRLYALMRRRPQWLLAVVALAVAALWLDGGWRSSYYLASYAAIGLAAVVAGLRWSLLCGGLLAVGYVAGLALNDYSWADLKQLNDADSVVANTGGYLIAACFLTLPITWLGGYVARMHQVLGEAEEGGGRREVSPPRDRPTGRLSGREIQVVQLVAGGAKDKEIAERLYISLRTVHSHVNNAREKTGAKNRAELAAMAVEDGLVPDRTAISA